MEMRGGLVAVECDERCAELKDKKQKEKNEREEEERILEEKKQAEEMEKWERKKQVGQSKSVLSPFP